ncbi:PAS domain-containing protein [Marinibaculum pumilum]|uniref:PAS domain-containing protein n=1 Tax=Marinibaculum pumilum TaxID=1766165 RepID=A0ABV7L5L6_9PROT
MNIEEIGIAEIHPASFQTLLAAWYRQKGARDYPPAAALDPFLAPTLLPNAILLEVDGDRFIYRLIGDAIRQLVGQDLRGKSVQEFMGDTDYARLIEEQFRRTIADRAPLYSVHDFRRPEDGLTLSARRIVMPYADGGRVTRLLAYQVAEGLEPVGGVTILEPQLLSRTVFRVRAPQAESEKTAGTGPDGAVLR